MTVRHILNMQFRGLRGLPRIPLDASSLLHALLHALLHRPKLRHLLSLLPAALRPRVHIRYGATPPFGDRDP